MEEIQSPKTYELQGKLKQIFDVGTTIKTHLKNELIKMYSTSSFRNAITPDKLHKLVLNIFNTEYYPMISRNLKIDDNNLAVIMGGVAFNMNVPKKMINFLETETDDIDLKIYTTDITTHNKSEKYVARVLSIFRFMILIICMYIKQISSLIVDFTDELFAEERKTKKTLKTSKSKKSKTGKTHKTHKTHKSASAASSINKPKIEEKQKVFGIVKNCKAFIIIKSAKGNESTDISQLSYEDTFNFINENIVDIDALITNKMFYYVRYMKPFGIPQNKIKITISDSKIIYANNDYPAFYAYNFMKHRKNMEKPLSTLSKMNFQVSDIIDTKPCRNNCKYIAVDSLLLDITLMLSYADLLEKEDVPSGNVLVPIGSIFKYYKYMIKFIKLHIIKKYYNGSLSVKFINPAKKLLRYVKDTLDKKTEQVPENLPINIAYKELLNKFHQDFFFNKSLLRNYIELGEVVETYHKYSYFINRSRDKFKEDINKEDINKEEMNNGNISISGGGVSRSIMYKDIEYDDYELDNLQFTTKEKNKLIREKISNMFKEEINHLNKLSRRI